MHALVRLYIKTAILFLGVGLALGAVMITHRELFAVRPSPYTVSAHAHAIFVGFVMMMILGVALWLFPRPATGDTRYSPLLIRVAYLLITLATAVRIGAELLRTINSGAALRWAVVLAGVGQMTGIGIFFSTIWSRIRPAGSQAREAKGERF